VVLERSGQVEGRLALAVGSRDVLIVRVTLEQQFDDGAMAAFGRLVQGRFAVVVALHDVVKVHVVEQLPDDLDVASFSCQVQSHLACFVSDGKMDSLPSGQERLDNLGKVGPRRHVQGRLALGTPSRRPRYP
jgi:hypothetical protein